MMSKTKTILVLGVVAVFYTTVTPAVAGQQQWASQYVSWKPERQASEVLSLEQEVWIAKTERTSYWPMQFGLIGMQGGGYIGLQQGSGQQQARFSIWNAIAAEGPSCKPFDGEGIGQTCILPIKIDTGKRYRLRLSRLEAAPDGQWWAGSLTEIDQAGTLVERRIGRIKAPAGAKFINPIGISNFVEYYGPSLGRCDQVPLSIAIFFPPVMSEDGKGTSSNQVHTGFAGSKRASKNLCATGGEPAGAAITATPRTFGSAEAAVVHLGGTPRQHALELSKNPLPKPLPHT